MQEYINFAPYSSYYLHGSIRPHRLTTGQVCHNTALSMEKYDIILATGKSMFVCVGSALIYIVGGIQDSLIM